MATAASKPAPKPRTAPAPAAAPAPQPWLPPPRPDPVQPAAMGAPMMMGQMRTSGMAIASLVLGIASYILCFVYAIGFITGIVAIVMGALAMREIKRNPMGVKGQGMAIAGLVLGIIIVAIFLVIFIMIGFAFDTIMKCIDNPKAAGCPQEATVLPDVDAFAVRVTEWAATVPVLGFVARAGRAHPDWAGT